MWSSNCPVYTSHNTLSEACSRGRVRQAMRQVSVALHTPDRSIPDFPRCADFYHRRYWRTYERKGRV